MNPARGIIHADEIRKLIIENDKIDPIKTEIVCRVNIQKMNHTEYFPNMCA